MKARELLAAIWRERTKLFPMGAPPPLGMLEPAVAAQLLGVSYQVFPRLGTWGRGNDSFEIAGRLDQQQRVIAVSEKFRYPVMRFTGAHEIAHVALNHPGRVIHRDRPILRIESAGRNSLEREADYFAACFLAPAQLVIEAYQQRYPVGPPLPLTDTVAFHLCGESAHALMRAGSESMQFACAVASATSFDGRHFMSMAEQFGISVSAMAIRLRELNLIEG